MNEHLPKDQLNAQKSQQEAPAAAQQPYPIGSEVVIRGTLEPHTVLEANAQSLKLSDVDTPVSVQDVMKLDEIATFSKGSRTFDRSVNAQGVALPLYKQSDKDWKAQILGSEKTISKAGCALSSTAMAISMLTGETVTPADLDDYLDNHDGYTTKKVKQTKDDGTEEEVTVPTDNLLWWKAAMAKPNIKCEKDNAYDYEKLKSHIAAGNPAVIGGDRNSDNKSDHWICAYAIDSDGNILAHDPSEGKVIVNVDAKDEKKAATWTHSDKTHTVVAMCRFSKKAK